MKFVRMGFASLSKEVTVAVVVAVVVEELVVVAVACLDVLETCCWG